jgi:hypothetical protein
MNPFQLAFTSRVTIDSPYEVKIGSGNRSSYRLDRHDARREDCVVARQDLRGVQTSGRAKALTGSSGVGREKDQEEREKCGAHRRLTP